jgi:hypothetical protein
MFEDKVAHNLWKEGWVFYLSLCQIWADDNASTGAFTMGNYYWWNSRNNSIGLHLLITCRIFINILICWLFSVNIVVLKTLTVLIILLCEFIVRLKCVDGTCANENLWRNTSLVCLQSEKKNVLLELVLDNYHSDNKNHIWFYRLHITEVITTKVKK